MTSPLDKSTPGGPNDPTTFNLREFNAILADLYDKNYESKLVEEGRVFFERTILPEVIRKREDYKIMAKVGTPNGKIATMRTRREAEAVVKFLQTRDDIDFLRVVSTSSTSSDLIMVWKNPPLPVEFMMQSLKI